MFENMTYEYLLKRALSNVPTNVDKRQGSVIYDTLAPACAELAQAYIQMEIMMQEAFADTASREYLILRAKERGLTPYGATRAVLKMEVTYSAWEENVKVGDRFTLNGLTYAVIEQCRNETDDIITTTPFPNSSEDNEPGTTIWGWWQVQCETPGTIGNTQFGSVVPVETITDLTSATITELLIPGEDEEDTETFRQRYFDSINSDAFGGNRADYLQWVKEMDGVGQVKVKRTPDGGGTVGIIITDAEGNPATQTLINEVKEALDPTEYTGQGEGIAPIGHSVTVTTVSEESVDIMLNFIEYEEGVNVDTVNKAMDAILESYAEEINQGWENRTSTKIYATQALARCLDVSGIVNIKSAYFDTEDTDGSYIVLGEDKIVKFLGNY